MANGLSDRKADKQELMEITEEAYEGGLTAACSCPSEGSILWLAVPPVKWPGRIGLFQSGAWPGIDRRHLPCCKGSRGLPGSPVL